MYYNVVLFLQARMAFYNNWPSPLSAPQCEVCFVYTPSKCNMAVSRHGAVDNSLHRIGYNIHAYSGLQESERAVLEEAMDVSALLDT